MTETAYDRILVTAALPYANGPIHIGHLAGAYLPADLYCRYQRLKGRDIVFICGSDEHGVPIMMRAREEGISPQEVVNRYHEQIRRSFADFRMSFDYYGRTSSQLHHETSQGIFRHLAGKHVFRLKSEEQLYDPQADMFLADRFVRGTCPVCGYEDAYGDQCENCGSSLNPADLKNPRSAITDSTPEMRETTHWYLPLADFQSDLEEWIGGHPEWKSNVLGQIRSWFKHGLKDRAMTRDLSWGVPVPTDVAERESVDVSGKVLYVWFDAPIGYISATKEWAAARGEPELWLRYWQDERTKLVHFIGKDNIVFHCIIFPALLKAHGSYVLPDNVPANEFLNLEGGKLSTSRSWAVWLHEYLEDFPADLLRYALATTLPETKDADFSWAEFQLHVNSELADVLGNFVNRTLIFASRYFEGKVPPLEHPEAPDLDVLAQLAAFPERIGASYETYRLREAVAETMALARMGNKYFNDTEPWHTRKSDLRACGNTIHVSLQICASLGVLLDPVLPDAAKSLREMLRLENVRSSMPGGNSGQIGWDDAGASLLAGGHELGEGEILFTKIPDEAIEAQIAKLRNRAARHTSEPAPTIQYAPVKDVVTFDEFSRLDLRTGRIVTAERIPRADKLLKLEVDLGFETRQVVAGIARQFEPEQLVGSKVIIVANLATREILGIESQGMVLMAEDDTGRLTLVSTLAEPGAVVR